MSENSFIQIYKELLLHPSFISAPHSYAKVLITIITHACYSACKMDDHGVSIDLLPGEFLCTIRRLAELSGATKKEVENALGRFSKAAILGQERRHTKTIHKILWGVKYKTMETALETKRRQDGDIKEEEQNKKNDHLIDMGIKNDDFLEFDHNKRKTIKISIREITNELEKSGWSLSEISKAILQMKKQNPKLNGSIQSYLQIILTNNKKGKKICVSQKIMKEKSNNNSDCYSEKGMWDAPLARFARQNGLKIK